MASESVCFMHEAESYILTKCISKFLHLNFQAEPPEIVVATLSSLCQMLEKNVLQLNAIRVLVVDEVHILFFLKVLANCYIYLLINKFLLKFTLISFISNLIP